MTLPKPTSLPSAPNTIIFSWNSCGAMLSTAWCAAKRSPLTVKKIFHVWVWGAPLIISCVAQRPEEHLAVAIAALAGKSIRETETVQLQSDASSTSEAVMCLILSIAEHVAKPNALSVLFLCDESLILIKSNHKTFLLVQAVYKAVLQASAWHSQLFFAKT